MTHRCNCPDCPRRGLTPQEINDLCLDNLADLLALGERPVDAVAHCHPLGHEVNPAALARSARRRGRDNLGRVLEAVERELKAVPA